MSSPKLWRFRSDLVETGNTGKIKKEEDGEKENK